MTMKRIDRSQKVRVGFHEAKWDEPIIYELSKPGERGILPLAAVTPLIGVPVVFYILTKKGLRG